MSKEPKILRRIVGTNQQTPPSVFSNMAQSQSSGSFAQRIALSNHPRNVGDGKKLGFDPKDVIDTTTIAGKVQDALLPIGYIDKTVIINLLKRLKIPIIGVLGVAAVAGLVYLAYKLFKSRQPEPVRAETVETIMESLRESAPDIISSESHRQNIRKQITNAVQTLTGDQLVEELAKITADTKQRQLQARPINVSVSQGGSLLDIISTKHGNNIKGLGFGISNMHIGSGIRATM